MDKRFTEGICGDGAAILDNGKQITITEILNNLNRLDELEQLRIGGVVKSLPTDEEIYSEASKYARQIKNPHNMTNIKLRQAYKNGAKLILNALKTTK